MKRKWILRTVLVLFLVLVVVFIIAAFSLGTILKRGVERVGPSATQVDVKLKAAEVWLLAWRFQLTGFVMGNPPGYKTRSSVEVGDVTVRFEPRSLLGNKLVVDSIKVKAPVITLEGGLMDNNLKKIEKNLDDYVGSSSTAPNSTAPADSPAKPEKKLQVNELVISGAKLQVNTTLSAGRTLTLSIPDIHLTDLGTGPEGITPVEVGQRALHAVLNAVAKEVAKNGSQLGKEALSEGKGATKNLGERLKGLFH
jgi:uncharacterized protein involved in outer membrane biogenesis